MATAKNKKKAVKALKRLPTWLAIIVVILVVAYVLLEAMGLMGGIKSYIFGLIYGRPDPVSGEVRVHIIDVGQGDSILVETEEGFVLIDAGTNESEDDLLTYLRKYGVSEIEYFVITHAHDDHNGGADMIFDEFTVKNVIYEDYGYKDDFFADMENEKANAIDAELRAEYKLGGATFTVISPDPVDYGTDRNDYSVVLRMDYGESSFVFTGDATKKVEKRILEEFSALWLDVDFLKSGHHGSKTSSGEEFITTLSPEIIAIPVGKDNKYGLPDEEVLEVYEAEGSTVYRTDIEGSLVFVSDGKTITRKTEG